MALFVDGPKCLKEKDNLMVLKYFHITNSSRATRAFVFIVRGFTVPHITVVSECLSFYSTHLSPSASGE